MLGKPAVSRRRGPLPVASSALGIESFGASSTVACQRSAAEIRGIGAVQNRRTAASLRKYWRVFMCIARVIIGCFVGQRL